MTEEKRLLLVLAGPIAAGLGLIGWALALVVAEVVRWSRRGKGGAR